MSLHTLANHIQSAGRGDDKVLVHMTPKEVHGLQALAMASGGSLTINPETGLPEAGWLSKLLPMIAGFALAPLTAGTSLAFLGASPLATAMTVGGVTGLATGSLKKGLMAGLGAYGGAGLSAGLSQAGTAAAANTVAPSAANEAAKQGLFSTPTMGNVASNAVTSGVKNAATNAITNALTPTPFSAISANPAGMMNGVPVPTVAPAANPVLNPTAAGVNTTAGATPIYPQQAAPAAPSAWDKIGTGAKSSFSSMENLGKLNEAANAAAPYYKTAAMGSITANDYYDQKEATEKAAAEAAKKNQGMIRPYEFNREVNEGVFDVGAPIWSDQPGSSAERNYFTETLTPLKPYKAPGPEYKAAGGLTALAVGGPVETMAAENAVGANLMYPQASLNTPLYSNPSMQRPEAVNVIAPSVGAGVGMYSGEARFAGGGSTALPTKGQYTYDYDPRTSTFTQTGRPEYVNTGRGMISEFLAKQQPALPENGTTYGGIAAPVGRTPQTQQPVYQAAPVQPYQSPEQQLGLDGFYDNMDAQLGAMGYAGGGLSDLGSYSDGGRLLRGPGDGVSDSIPAQIGDRQPARLADGEFVIPARIVSELGNGSTEAGARKLYTMMDRVQKARRKTVGKDKVATNTNAERLLPV